jgi:hypothetical protein
MVRASVTANQRGSLRLLSHADEKVGQGPRSAQRGETYRSIVKARCHMPGVPTVAGTPKPNTLYRCVLRGHADYGQTLAELRMDPAVNRNPFRRYSES